MSFSKEFAGLVEIMARLRDPENGCPWDIEQDFASIRHFTIEEAYEVADAIERKDYDDLCSELGDLLLQPVFHAQMASEAKLFDIEDVIRGINEKLIRRHPHIFDSKNELSSGDVLDQWENIKKDERKSRALKRGVETGEGLLDDIAGALPALMRAEKLARRVAKVGFDWPEASGALEKCREELAEVEDEMATGDKEKIQGEIGDLLFSVANLARKCGVSPEAALSEANAKFVRRFAHVEARCAQNNIALERAGLDTLQEFWDEVRVLDKEAQ
ncbi:MAG TPA: nucleoside triphosphate pyrophosphohydrolase [Devosia sp.]|nr:nucleoside triphosphate pyrophosphohydrolase [Devosia sp.]